MAEEAEPLSPKTAAVRIQKSYRGYRARRKLADAAIMAKAFGWWNIVDSAVLQEHTQQYYAHSKSWKAIDHWKRLKRKASKVGKGLEKSKDKPLKLALQHWLEAIDARHRYGHNLRPYYLHWLQLETHEPFFYWLDVGDGRQIELEKCSRAKLQEQQINYLSPEQRKHFEVSIYKGKLFFKESGELVSTTESDSDDRWIFVMSPSGKLYVGKKERGTFQHSSFLAGGATTAAGRLSIHKGILQLMEAHSGHYRPSPENFEALVRILIESGADLTFAKVQLVSDDLREKKQGKKLAGEVREAIKELSEEEHVSVKVENQSLVSVDSGLDETSYLVTNVTFPSDEPSAAKKLKKTKESTVSEALPSSQGFSRNSSLAALRPEERHEALQKYVMEPSPMVTV
ncbi:hypothetical protein M758_4G247800 [Ceratodon purpureus]|nr:hypothetical protein M758_4G247800 [Ceratodon purpureus]KAG0620831.1 hypothetical protein M758_4G247800 [Ceratodon purpureus]